MATAYAAADVGALQGPGAALPPDRPPRSGVGWRPSVRRRTAAVAVAAILAGGCASLAGGFAVASNGLARPDDALRRQMAAGRFDAALDGVGSGSHGAPDDELLRSLYAGILAHYDGRYHESAAAFERAIDLTYDRLTTSVSRGAASLVTSDRILAYEPDRVERTLIHYYNALNYLQLGDMDGAAVEARRLGAVLQRYDDAREPGDASTRALLRYFAGTVFEAAGERNDAAVAYRNARVLAGGGNFPLDTLPADTLGDVVVLIERGFVAHRVEQAVHVALLADEVESLTGGGDGRAATAALVAARVVAHAVDPAAASYTSPRRRPLVVELPAASRTADAAADACAADAAGAGEDAAEAQADCRPTAARRNPYLLRIAWPTYYREWRGAPRPTVLAGGARVATPGLAADLSRAVIAEFEHERTMILARTVARAATKLVVTRTVERRAGEVDETLGQVAGLLGNLTGAILERADTRSWHLLPGELHLIRLRLPPGSHQLSVETASGFGQTVELGEVTVLPGRVAIMSARMFR